MEVSVTNDSRDAAMRYRLRKEAIERGEDPPEGDESPAASRIRTRAERAAMVDVAIEQKRVRGRLIRLGLHPSTLYCAARTRRRTTVQHTPIISSSRPAPPTH